MHNNSVSEYIFNLSCWPLTKDLAMQDIDRAGILQYYRLTLNLQEMKI
jgi:hypothetical protein